MGKIKSFLRRFVFAEDETPDDTPPGSMHITTPDGKTAIYIDLVTAADARKARKLAELVLSGTIEIEDAEIGGLTD